MDSGRFSRKIDDEWIALNTATDVVRFSFIVQNSVSYLDLGLCKDSRISDYFGTLCGSCRSRSLKNFVNTEEKCRLFFAPRRRLLYTLHLDLPEGRECKLKGDRPLSPVFPDCCGNPHIVDIAIDGEFLFNSLSNIMEEALSSDIPKEKLLKWIIKIPFREVPLLSCLEIRTASKFIDCFYPEVTDPTLFDEFIKQFEITEWLMEYEQPEILEFLLYHAYRLGNISLDADLDFELISLCIYYKHYRNVGPILKYLSDSELTHSSYEDYRLFLLSEKPALTEDVIDKAEESINRDRLCRIIEIVWVFIESNYHGFQETAPEALRLIWSSVKDPCITLGELKNIFEAVFSEEELTKIHDFYVKTIGESHEYVEPRSLKHLCRTVLRDSLELCDWIPTAISQTGLPKSLQSFLNLDQPFGV